MGLYSTTCTVCHETIEFTAERGWLHAHSDEAPCGTGDGSVANPPGGGEREARLKKAKAALEAAGFYEVEVDRRAGVEWWSYNLEDGDDCDTFLDLRLSVSDD